MVDRDCFVDLDHHGVVHPHDANEVTVAVGQVDCVDLEAIGLALKEDVDDEVGVDQLPSDVGAGLLFRDGEVAAKVEDEAVRLPRPYEHGDVHARLVGLRVVDVDDGQAGLGGLVAEGAASVVELARLTEEGSETGTLVRVPQIGTESLVLARVWLALVYPRASRDRVHLFNFSNAVTDRWFLEIVLGDLHAVDGDVLDAAGEGGRVVG